ncbi:DUF4387 domain-containing protein [Cohnella nanjingensis]|uniref:DUF4387 domain-containing protein n=1 Tax=Cohnella nanjingensis TaxID=1387779 RepID=A0A7X0VCN4_9BACL|nr:DUF4387 domain-containing protein [Cohnella nanjingensis]MBB6669100.1 DUF4387 domain-containing protein [Cohnella nanjingensis]
MRLYEAASVLRSKNSGPFEITIDVLFDDPAIYYKIKDEGLIDRPLVSRLYGIPEAHITHLVFFDPALGFKITFARQVSSGAFLDRDVYGAQQHAPLLELELNL